MHPLAHLMTGAAIGQAVGNPAAAVIGGVLSHFVLDAMPHTEGKTFYGEAPVRLLRPDLIEAALEFAAGLLIVGWSLVRCEGIHLSVVVGALGALMPDLVDLPLKALLNVGPFFHLQRIHWTVTRNHAALGMLTQLIVIVAAWSFLWRAAACR